MVLSPTSCYKKRFNNDYELIDGQQRLTTIYLILYYLNQDFVEKSRDQLFTIDYETRKGTKEFLKNPQEVNDTNMNFTIIGGPIGMLAKLKNVSYSYNLEK